MKDLTDRPLERLNVDYGTRPTMPALPGATDSHRRAGRRLAAIHRHYLQDLSRIAQVLDRIKAGDSPPDHLRQIVLSLNMAQNFEAFGNLCGQECRVLKMHHDIEEQSLFPQLDGAGQNALSALVARLREEHHVVHELIGRLADAAQKLMASPTVDSFGQASAVFVQLRSVVASHFKYEETELEEALGLYADHF